MKQKQILLTILVAVVSITGLSGFALVRWDLYLHKADISLALILILTHWVVLTNFLEGSSPFSIPEVSDLSRHEQCGLGCSKHLYGILIVAICERF